MKTKNLTLSALSASLATVVLILGTIFAEILDLFAVIVAPIILSMPLYNDSIKGSILATLSAGILALLLSGFNIANFLYVSYFLFFGAFPIVKYYSVTRRKKKLIFNVICCIWFVVAVLLIYYYYTALMGLGLDMIFPISPDIIPLVLTIVAIPLYFIVDIYVYVAQTMLFKLLGRIIKK